MSLPVYATDPYLGTDWLVGPGYPHELRPGGWVYLRNGNHLGPRAKAIKVGWRESRPTRTGPDPGDFGPGIVVEVDPNSWEPEVRVELGGLAEFQRSGYRYLLTNDDDSVTHLVGGKATAGLPSPIVRTGAPETALLFVWNPDNWTWNDLAEAQSTTLRGDVWPFSWSTGSRHHFAIGERAYIVRQHHDRGIVASGIVKSFPYGDRHWDGSSNTEQYVDLELDAVTMIALPASVLIQEVTSVNWNRLQSSGDRVDVEAEALEELWSNHLKTVGFAPMTADRSAGEQGVVGALTEGAVRSTTVLTYERNPLARAACLNHYGPACSVCEMTFRAVYGELGEGFIHVHHLREISTVGEDYEVDPVVDLRPVCPNCHAMLHRQRPPLSIDALRGLINELRVRHRIDGAM